MSELFTADLTIGIDIASLPTFVGLAGIVALTREFDVTVQWVPLTDGLKRLSTAKPDDGQSDPLEAYKARRKRARDQWAQTELVRDCESLQIPVDAGARVFDSTMAGVGILFAASKGLGVPDYLERAFACAFREGGAIEEPDTVSKLLDDPSFANYVDEGRETLEHLQSALLEAGIFSSPAFVMAGERYQGRQHLPLLKWHLSGANGSPPV